MVLRGEFQRNLLYNLKVLKLLHWDVLRHEILEQVPNIEKLVVRYGLFKESLGNLISIVACRVSFSNLTYLDVESCNNLRYLFTSSAAKSLDQLKIMEIKGCESIEEGR